MSATIFDVELAHSPTPFPSVVITTHCSGISVLLCRVEMLEGADGIYRWRKQQRLVRSMEAGTLPALMP